MRIADVDPPQELGVRDGLSYGLFLPAEPARGGVVVLHGADSCKESHYDFARRCRAHGLAAIAFDQRGHGETGGRLDGRMAADVATIAELLPPGPVVLRGSSMGGYLAIVAAAGTGAAGVVAICPATAEGLRRGVRSGRFSFAADAPALDDFLSGAGEAAAVRALGCPLLLLHAEGDEVVPVECSVALQEEARRAGVTSRLVTTPGGHHRSVQHDAELQDLCVRFAQRSLAAVP